MIITDTQTLCQKLNELKQEEFVTIDTEFIREETYWPRLCLVQIAGADQVIIIDVLEKTLSLDPLFDFILNSDVLKVFHAARQDLEIFYHLTEKVPQNIFDTQIAAMVCGFGEQVGYETLVAQLTQKKIDKSQQYSDWIRRPLSERQIKYACDDVIHLRKIYQKLCEHIKKFDRLSWIEEELEALKCLDLYQPKPDQMWMKLKLKNTQPYFLARLKAIAALRERKAISLNIPRGRWLRDELIIEIALNNPQDSVSLGEIRGMSHHFAWGENGTEVLKTIQDVNHLSVECCPALETYHRDKKPSLGQIEFLRVFLKIIAEQHQVAEKLIANSKDLESFLNLKQYDEGHKLLKGWRYDIFGKQAWDLKQGNKGLIIKDKKICVMSFQVQEE